MKEYLPWSKATLQTAIEKYKKGSFSILDIQLGGECNGDCIYCDSPDRNKKCTINFDALEGLVSREHHSFDWMFVCGLGEPLFGPNREKLLFLLRLCEKYGIKCSIFSNGSLIDDQIIPYIENEVLFLMIKMDSFSVKKLEALYGSAVAKRNLVTINELFELTELFESDYCHIGASIVPTKQNINEIPSIVEKCISKSFYPLIAELECSGRSTGERFEEMHLSKNEHKILKEKIEQMMGEEYHVPVCPAVIAGIHITNEGKISVDAKSGLSCPWFWLSDMPDYKLCSIEEIKSFTEAERLILDYRNARYKELMEIAKEVEEYPFGGCGGNMKGLLEEYIMIQKHFF